jgi:uncharacterized YigZ family protein
MLGEKMPDELFRATHSYNSAPNSDIVEHKGIKPLMCKHNVVYDLLPLASLSILRRITMLERYKTVYRGNVGEIVEKKSRFIATVRLVESEEEALQFIEEMRKKYWNATHNCFAYVIGERRELVRCSDDGEPSGTAGKPMLDVLLGEELYNTAVVVTRYFGGTLLGTGGLVRAYSKAVQEGLAQSEIIEKQYGSILEIGTDYQGLGKIQYMVGEKKLPVLESEYTDKVTMKILLPVADTERFVAELTEGTNGRAQIEEKEKLYYAVLNGKVLMGDDLRPE